MSAAAVWALALVAVVAIVGLTVVLTHRSKCNGCSTSKAAA